MNYNYVNIHITIVLLVKYIYVFANFIDKSQVYSIVLLIEYWKCRSRGASVSGRDTCVYSLRNWVVHRLCVLDEMLDGNGWKS